MGEVSGLVCGTVGYGGKVDKVHLADDKEGLKMRGDVRTRWKRALDGLYNRWRCSGIANLGKMFSGVE